MASETLMGTLKDFYCLVLYGVGCCLWLLPVASREVLVAMWGSEA